MKQFADLYRAIDETTKTNRKIQAMREHFQSSSSDDAAWAVFFLSGERFKRVVSYPLLRQWATTTGGISDWLFEESYNWVGDLAETISLVVPSAAQVTEGSLDFWVQHRIQPLRGAAPEELFQRLNDCWNALGPQERFVFLKLITGGLRVGVSKRLVVRAIAEAFNVPTEWVAHRLTGTWLPTAEAFESLKQPSQLAHLPSQPYPFCLAYPCESEIESLGSRQEYQAEWKWDGIRGQLIRRNGETYLWTRGEERVEQKYPEVVHAAKPIPDGTVLDGELLAWRENSPLAFSELQKRIGRKQVTSKILQQIPVCFMAYDLLEWQGRDLRNQALSHRRSILEQAIADTEIILSRVISEATWKQLAEARKSSRMLGAEGLMLKRIDSPYQVGRVRGAWWKWKIEPLTIDAVLVYAQKGHGKRSSLFTDYTFALWDGDQLVPFAKAYSGLTDAEIRLVDRFIKANVREKFGPVRSVVPALVMELAFENIQLSTRHKSGFAVRFPRIVRWRQDKLAQDANSVKDLKQLIELHGISAVE